ncbi:hypothetical protein E2320_001932 [Naja naja]|nr:hypothetical protein E2320_001932 [Naja naja]
MLQMKFGDVTLQEPTPLKEWTELRQSGVPSVAERRPLTSSSPVGGSDMDMCRGLDQYDLQSRGSTGPKETMKKTPRHGVQMSSGTWHGLGTSVWEVGTTPLHASFDGSADRLAVFLGQVINHFDLYGEARGWAADLHREHSRHLADIGLFLNALRTRFEDNSEGQQAEDVLLALRQKGRPVREYVNEFHRAADCILRPRPDLSQTCLYQGLPQQIEDSYQMTMELDSGLRKLQLRTRSGSGGWRGPLIHSTKLSTTLPPLNQGGRESFCCFHCNRQGHQGVDCPIPLGPHPAPALQEPGIEAHCNIWSNGKNIPRQRPHGYDRRIWQLLDYSEASIDDIA